MWLQFYCIGTTDRNLFTSATNTLTQAEVNAKLDEYDVDELEMKGFIAIIDGGITVIGEHAFYGISSGNIINKNLLRVVAPTVTTVCKWAFRFCTNLTTVDIPLLTTIEIAAFQQCQNLTTANFPLLTNIESHTFSYCTTLTTVDMPLLTSIGNGAFASCHNLKTISLPKVISVGGSAFHSCWALVSVDIPEVTTIGNGSFAGCSALTAVNFPKVETIGTFAFTSCPNLKTISFGTGFETETKINFSVAAFGGTFDSGSVISTGAISTPDIDLILGENVLPLPNLTAMTWQDTVGDGTGAPYVWKNITVYSSIEETIKKRTVNIFPNPAVSAFTVSFELEKSCNMKIVLSDILGQELIQIYDGFATVGTFTRTVNTEHLAKGIYFLKILIDGKYTVEKIVVEIN